MEDQNSIEKIWVNDASVLLDDWQSINPLDKDDSIIKRFNASTRLLIVVGLLATTVTKKFKYLGASVIALGAMYLYLKSRSKPAIHANNTDDMDNNNSLSKDSGELDMPPKGKKINNPHQFRRVRPFIPYDRLGNEQTYFGFNSNVMDPSFSENLYNSERMDRMVDRNNLTTQYPSHTLRN